MSAQQKKKEEESEGKIEEGCNIEIFYSDNRIPFEIEYYICEAEIVI